MRLHPIAFSSRFQGTQRPHPENNDPSQEGKSLPMDDARISQFVQLTGINDTTAREVIEGLQDSFEPAEVHAFIDFVEKDITTYNAHKDQIEARKAEVVKPLSPALEKRLADIAAKTGMGLEDTTAIFQDLRRLLLLKTDEDILKLVERKP